MALAKQYGFVYREQPNFDVTDHWLQLSDVGINLINANLNAQPLQVDFTSPKTHYRLKQLSCRKEQLIRAVGLHQHPSWQVVDATGGLGMDSVLLASCGSIVTTVEQNTAIFVLLEDGIRRARDVGLAFAERIRLVYGNAVDALKTLRPIAEAIYMDPMYPHPNTRQLPGRGMQYLRALLEEDTSNEVDLFHAAISHATRRVVVKRHAKANWLVQRPSWQINGKTARFDVYDLT
jgi:16S rRNA (guanine1516-N2)-methyltransferase